MTTTALGGEAGLPPNAEAFKYGFMKTAANAKRQCRFLAP
jgi:hypothetical protein